MKLSGVLLVLLVFATIIVICFSAEEVITTDPSLEIGRKKSSSLKDSSTAKPGESKSDLNPSKVDQEKNSEKHDVMPLGGNKKDPGTSGLSKDLDSKVVPKVGTGKDDSSKELLVKKRGDEKEGSNGESGSKPKEVKQDGDLVSSKDSKPVREGGTRAEECGASSKCIIKSNNLIGCLRIPGNESPDLSLLIQNKGTGPLTVKILAPDFVQLEKSSVHLQDKEDKKVKVSIGKGTNGTTIILTARGGNCSIDFRDLMLHYSGKKVQYITKSSFTNILTKAPPVVSVYVFIAALLLVTPAWMCVRFHRRHLSSDGSKYEKLETELPSSSKGKTESDVTDGWDNSWGDSWDDEEAPKTPSKPVTPSLSSKRVASRRFSKEGWKD